MSKSMPSPDSNVPLPFYAETAFADQPSDERAQHVASFMLDMTEPEHVFSEQPVVANPSTTSEIRVRGIRPIYDVVIDPDASEAAQDQGFGRMPVFHKPEGQAKPESKAKSHRPIENQFTDIGKEPPYFDPNAIIPVVTADSNEISPSHQEVKDIAHNLEVQRLMTNNGLSLEAANQVVKNRSNRR